MTEKKVTAVVVTYNRKELLAECLTAILNQSVRVQNIIVINNASTDGTELLFEPQGMFYRNEIQCIHMETNTGGSGGFYEGMRIFMSEGVDWLWIMDDDTIPTTTCLEKLIEADDIIGKNKKTSFYASAIFGPDGECMNVPNIDMSASANGYPYFYRYLADGNISIKDATFVSLLIRKDAIEKCGLPCKDYFIWGDDGEYTLRLTHYYGPAYMVGKSVAIHKRIGAKKLSMDSFQDPNRIRMYHYYVRNNIINQLYYKKDRNGAITIAKKLIQAMAAVKYLSRTNGVLRFRMFWKGTLEGIFQYRMFKSYIDAQLRK